MNEHRVDDLPDHIAADVTDHNKIIHGEADEPGAAFDGFAQQLAAFPDIAMAPQDLIAEGNQVVVRFVATDQAVRRRHPLGAAVQAMADAGTATGIRCTC